MTIAIGLICGVLCVGIFVFRGEEGEKLQYDDREFQVLLEENILVYEQNLRDRHRIPTNSSVQEYFGESYLDKVQEENKKFIAHRRAVQILAEQYCGVEPLNYDELLALMKEENVSRAKKNANGEVVYGVTEFDFSQFSAYYWTKLENLILNQIMNNRKIDREKLEEFYQAMDEPLYTDGEIVSYYLYSSEGQLDFSRLQNQKSRQVDLTFEEIRQTVRQYEGGEETFLNFDKNQIHYLYSESGQNFYIQFKEIQKDPELSENEWSIIKRKIAREVYEKELKEIIEKWKI